MKSRKLVTLLALILALALGSSGMAEEKSSQEKSKSASSAQQAEPSKPKAATEDPGFIIGAEDVLTITVWKEADLSRAVQVRPDGMITLPLINDIAATGMTPMQLASMITEKLKKFIADPQVSVIVSTINSRRYFIMGEVNRSGAYALQPNTTVLMGLASAGGFNQFANLKKIYVMRTEDGKQVKYPFNYKDVIKGLRPEQNIMLKPGDTIVVP